MNSRNKKQPVLVVAHDAGGAEMLAAYVGANSKKHQFDVYAAEPAFGIFRREGVAAKKIARSNLKKVINAHRDSSVLLGTGHPKSLELAALKEAKKQGIPTVSYLDSWKRYRERFGYPSRGWKKNLPDKIWAGDRVAYALARKCFPSIIVERAPNFYFQNVRSRVKSTRRREGAILFLSVAGNISFAVLEAILLDYSSKKKSPEIIVRLHPLNDRRRFDALARSFHARVVLSDSDDIASDISKAQVAIGGETTALAVAAYSGLPAVCLWRATVPLPFKGMERASSPKTAVRILKKMLRD